jgi:hypothetical protein
MTDQRPDLHRKVLAKEISANAAAVVAGFRKPTQTVPIDTPECGSIRRMGRTDQVCSLCSAPESVRDYVEAQVRARRKLRDLEREVAFSKSVISKHMRTHVPKREAFRHNAIKKINMSGRRTIIEWPEVPGFARHIFTLQSELDDDGRSIERPRGTVIEILEKDLRESDVIIRVSFEEPLPARIEHEPEQNNDTPAL